MPSPFGSGTYVAQITERGGGSVLWELSTPSISLSRVLNGTGQARVTTHPTDRQGWKDALREAESWRHELVIYRDRELAFVGPIIPKSSSGEFGANDLFAWMDVRFIEEDFHFDGDAADCFDALFHAGYDKEPSPNINITAHGVGVPVVRDYKAVEFRKCGDVMRELARTKVDYTVIGRQILAGRSEEFVSTTPLILHNEGCKEPPEVNFEGDNLATDVAVFGSSEEQGGIPFTGRATRSVDVYGLVQRSFTELNIKDQPSADANALSRLENVQPAPLRVRARLSAQAGFEFKDLVPGRLMDCRLRDDATGIEVMEVMRLQQVDVEAGPGSEDVTISLVPEGEASDG